MLLIALIWHFPSAGHGQEKGSDEFSPIFLQFLDCLFQVHKQCSHMFEFNSRYILAIADHIYSCRFSTFLFSCDKDRVSLLPCLLASNACSQF
ncbi:hypothetical protein EON64_08685 [archaeon]|nr:MAG: hypothetical protein EON64_08685 [archaeon]